LNKFKGLFYGWRMIAVSCAIRLLGGGLHSYGFTILFLPVTQELGLTRAATSLVFSLARAEGAIQGPLAGYFIDRFGPRPVMVIATLFAGIGYMMFAGVNSYAALVIVYMGVVSLSYQAGFMDATMTVANNWFIRKRALAMSFTSGSISLGGMLLTPLLAFAVHTWGWRAACFGAGVAFLGVGLPLALTIRRSPESMGLLPDGETLPQAGAARAAVAAVREFPLRAALRTYQFWLIALATTMRVICSSTVLVHFVPILVWRGLTEQRAAVFLAFVALLGMPTHLLTGWLGDRIDKPRLMATCTAIASLSLWLIFHGDTDWHLWPALALFSLFEGLFPVTWATVSDFFGRRNFAKIRGSMSFLYMWGSVIGPVAAGLVYDHTQSYDALLWGLIGLCTLTTLCYALLKPPGSVPRATMQP
jgi:MFS family permease